MRKPNVYHKHTLSTSKDLPARADSPLTFEQQPPNIRASMPPTASHCGIVSINMRPTKAIILEEAGRGSSIPYISAFSRDGLASITFGVMTSPSVAEAWRSLRVERLRGTVIGEAWLLFESALRFRAIWNILHSVAVRAGKQPRWKSQESRGLTSRDEGEGGQRRQALTSKRQDRTNQYSDILD